MAPETLRYVHFGLVCRKGGCYRDSFSFQKRLHASKIFQEVQSGKIVRHTVFDATVCNSINSQESLGNVPRSGT
jgi:hypothetical protein